MKFPGRGCGVPLPAPGSTRPDQRGPEYGRAPRTPGLHAVQGATLGPILPTSDTSAARVSSGNFRCALLFMAKPRINLIR